MDTKHKLCLINQCLKTNPLRERKILIRIKLVTTSHVLGIEDGNCPLYIEELRANKKKSEPGAAVSGNLFAIELFNLTYKLNSWVYDTGCGIHVCNTLQGFKVERKLSYGVQYLQVGNGTQAAVEAIGMFDLVYLRLILKLKAIVIMHLLLLKVLFTFMLLDSWGFHHTIASNGISVSLNGIFYFSAISVNGVFEIDINNNVPKNNSIFSINKKRKLDLDSSYLWHCRLAHIGKTRMQKLHREGLLENIDEESFDKCESCISGKMTKKPFNKNIERATDLLGLIHTDDRRLNALRSDRGGEYLSQEFKDYLSENGIVQNLTSPYTPQQNGVSERRNRTLLDMVRSMFNLTTLPLSFWDYALESVVRILNMETMGYYFYFPPENKVIVARYGDFLERDLISQEFSGRDYDLEDDHMDTLPSENTSEIPVEPESLGSPSELIPVRRSERTKRAPNRLCLNMEVEDDEVMRTSIWEQPEGFVDPIIKRCMQTSKGPFYGEASITINGINYLLRIILKVWDFIQNRDETCVYRKASGSDVVFLILYVGLLIMGTNIPRCTRQMWRLLKLGQSIINKSGSSTGCGFCDASGMRKDDTKSQTGYVFIVNGGAVDWKSKKQTTIAMHATQSEYMAASEAAMEAVWIRKFVGDLGVMPSINKPINMYCDNSAAIIFANEPGVMKGARHFLRRYHYVREQVESGEIKLIKSSHRYKI
ncbi:retrotransposon protein, putative, ty1-copia subclass [Tanacetum coccineum]